MRVIPGSHLRQMAFVNTPNEHNLLPRGQTIIDVDESKAVHMNLQPGEFSIHHEAIVHNSDPNNSDDRRIGMSIHYIPTSTRQVKYLEKGRKPLATLPIYGSDLYGDTLKLAQANLRAAGLEEAVQLKQANVLEISAPAATGILVTNPPYGERMGAQQDLAEFYPKFGDALKQKFAGWNCYILSADMNLPKLIKLQVSKRTPLFNGALECRLFEYRIVAGSMRGPKPVQGDAGAQSVKR